MVFAILFGWVLGSPGRGWLRRGAGSSIQGWLQHHVDSSIQLFQGSGWRFQNFYENLKIQCERLHTLQQGHNTRRKHTTAITNTRAVGRNNQRAPSSIFLMLLLSCEIIELLSFSVVRLPETGTEPVAGLAGAMPPPPPHGLYFSIRKLKNIKEISYTSLSTPCYRTG